MPGSSEPAVSIILPTFNRAAFLSDAFGSIRAQTMDDWELVVVDDGSTDDTRSTVEAFAQRCPRRVTYRYQQNLGPAAARNAGVDAARGRYIAFYDSDDLWRPHHLQHCLEAFESCPDVDWVYGSCQLIELATGRQLQASSFHPGGRPHPFMDLSVRSAGNLRVITDPRAAECMITDGLMCGLQCSVLKRRVFDAVRLPLFRVGEDQIFVVHVLKAGFRLAYFDNVHAIYRVHEQGSATRPTDDRSCEKAVTGLRELVRAYEELPGQVSLDQGEQRALHRRLADECFWTLGYSLLWQQGRKAEALGAFRQGLAHAKWDLRLWKTYTVAVLKTALTP